MYAAGRRWLRVRPDYRLPRRSRILRHTMGAARINNLLKMLFMRLSRSDNAFEYARTRREFR